MKKLVSIIVPIIFILIGGLLHASSLKFIKPDNTNIKQLKRHPLEDEFNKPLLPEERKRNQNQVLVLLIEYNDDELIQDNPQTTGNGKFQQDPSDYPITLGKPPHNYDYFMMQMKALKNYYKAASLYYDDQFREYGLNLEYDIYPKPGDNGEHIAYTLPKSMAYYTPVTTDYDLLVSRFEEYFHDAFTIADQDEDIDFSNYGHFILLHAGSDWQHDINGDTPSDMPSFFIKIGDGKEVIVDDGVEISYACNVPETISQDISLTDGNIPIVSGYGLINAVIAHEFGHSLGFVDLYNTQNNYPIVGYYDIMDSGGMGRLTFPVNIDGDVDYENPVAYYDLEGCLPVLPGAFSRMLAWEDQFRYRGYLKDISELNLNSEIRINPASKKPYSSTGKLYFVKVPINDHEYLLIENRQVDPDGDGGTAVQSSEDKRVILYPTPISDAVLDSMSYEYDFLLPGWFRETGEALGGGLVIWHIDTELLYQNNNFENNTVNPSLAERAVKIIEADDIHDLGNPYAPSWSWRGTEYDPYYKFSPILDDEGNFIDWDIEYSDEGQLATHNDILSATSSPALLSNSGNPSIYSIYDISSYSITSMEERIMSFKIGANQFEEIIALSTSDSIYTAAYAGYSFGLKAFPVFTENGIDFYYLIGDEWTKNAVSPQLNLTFSPEYPIFAHNYLTDSNQEGNEYFVVERNTIHLLNPNNNEANPPATIDYPNNITDSPLYIDQLSTLVTPTRNHLYIDGDSLTIAQAKCAFDGSRIVAVSNDKMYLIDPSNTDNKEIINLPETTGNYYPVCYQDNSNSIYNSIFIQSEDGDIYKYNYNNLEKIFSLSPYKVSSPTQLALGNPIQANQINLLFAAEDKVFLIDLWGTMAENFPIYIEGKNFETLSDPQIIRIYNTSLLLIPEGEGGYLALNEQGDYLPGFSNFWDDQDKLSQYIWDEINQSLYFVFIDGGNSLYATVFTKIDENPLIWNGYKNNGYALFSGKLEIANENSSNLTVTAFPNPAKNGEVRIRVANSSGNIKLKIFDIAGNLVHNKSYSNLNPEITDIRWETNSIASGIYFGIIKSGNEQKKIPIAIIN